MNAANQYLTRVASIMERLQVIQFVEMTPKISI